MTELSIVLGINANKLVPNWGTKGSVKGLTQNFLGAHASEMLKEESPDFFSANLALLIHGIILFPNMDKFVDHLAIEIFLMKNLVSFMFADFYHTFHTRHEKKGCTFLYCAPLLHLWMRSRMPQLGTFVQSNLTWPQKFASLSASSILWYKREWETKEVIAICGGFLNVPLIGTQGCNGAWVKVGHERDINGFWVHSQCHYSFHYVCSNIPFTFFSSASYSVRFFFGFVPN